LSNPSHKQTSKQTNEQTSGQTDRQTDRPCTQNFLRRRQQKTCINSSPASRKLQRVIWRTFLVAT